MVYHIRHEKNWCLDKNFDQKLIHSSQIDLKHQMSISTQAVPKTTSKYLPFGTNLVSVAQFVQKWEQFKEKLSKWQMFVKKQFGYDDIYFRACSVDQIFVKKSWKSHIKKCINTIFQELFSEFNYLYYFLSYAVM